MTDILNDIIDATNTSNSPKFLAHRDIDITDGGMARSLDGDAQRLSAQKPGDVVIARQNGEGNTRFGLDNGQRLTVLAQNGSEGARIKFEDLVKDQGMDWDYYAEPVCRTLDGSDPSPTIPSDRALYRIPAGTSIPEDGSRPAKGEYLSTVGADFCLDLGPRSLARVMDDAIAQANSQGCSWKPSRVIEMRDGAYMGFQTTLGNLDTPRGNMDGRLTMGAGFGGNDAFSAAISAVLAVCQNTFMHAVSDTSKVAVRVKHTKNMMERIDEAVDALLRGESTMRKKIEWMRRADRLTVSVDHVANHLAKLIFPHRDHSLKYAEDGATVVGVKFDDSVKVPNQTIVKREAFVSAFEASPGAHGRTLLDVAQALTYVTSHRDGFQTKKRKGGKDPMTNEESILRGSTRQAQEHGFDMLHLILPFEADVAAPLGAMIS